jgi:hypothetical protein
MFRKLTLALRCRSFAQRAGAGSHRGLRRRRRHGWHPITIIITALAWYRLIGGGYGYGGDGCYRTRASGPRSACRFRLVNVCAW